MFTRLASLLKAFFNSIMGKMEDPEMMLEQTYQDLQNNLIQVRQAVAQAIATEKQLEQQYRKNADQAQTWHNRATMAVQQGNDDLARQALQRKQQYTQAANDLETQLKAQKEATNTLRQRLTELEGEVQKAYTKKQVLIARDKAAQATTKANEILSKSSADGALSVMDKMEQKVLERESKAAALAELGSDQLDKKFKSFEGQVDIEAELMMLKGSSGGSQKLIAGESAKAKEPVLVEANDTVDIEDIKESEKE
ncbi:MAG: PspA/IM30 family protein [Candidatus Obscuribacterales bacterium]|nr:PspA/IM30 family protein [Candidatus Obscuribacterales bacterium]